MDYTESHFDAAGTLWVENETALPEFLACS